MAIWRSGCAILDYRPDIDEIGDKENVGEYTKTREEFLTILGEEEQKMGKLKLRNGSLVAVMRRTAECRLSWFVHCLDSVNAMYNLFL